MADKARATILRGERTADWYANDRVQQVFEEIQQDISLLWEKTASDQDDERERLYREMHGLRALRHRILKIIDDGKKAKARIQADGDGN